jgi:hypothetical protein
MDFKVGDKVKGKRTGVVLEVAKIVDDPQIFYTRISGRLFPFCRKHFELVSSEPKAFTMDDIQTPHRCTYQLYQGFREVFEYCTVCDSKREVIK